MRPLGLIVDPILEFLVTIPPPAVIPIVMVLAGIGDAAKIAVIGYAMIPGILITTIETVRQAPPMLDRVGRSLRLNRLERMALIDLPAAFPGIVTGFRLAISTSLLVTITSEMLLSTNGIGAFVQRSQESFYVSSGLAGIVAIAIVGLSSTRACAMSRIASCSGTTAAASPSRRAVSAKHVVRQLPGRIERPYSLSCRRIPGAHGWDR